MTFISRGFRGRRQLEVPAGRLPPGQYATNDFPVLSAGPTRGSKAPPPWDIGRPSPRRRLLEGAHDDVEAGLELVGVVEAGSDELALNGGQVRV